MRRLLRLLRDAWVIAGITLLLVLLVDAVLRDRAGAQRWPRVEPGAEAPDRRSAPAYGGYATAGAYWQEHGAAKAMRWEPYAYWRREPFAGEAINVDAEGLRRTWRGPSPPDRAAQAPVLWVIGGSSVWGTGVVDAETVPSWLARLAAERGIPLRVVNLGESGYVTGQSLAFLQARLRTHPPPALVLFLEGANDVFAALQAGRAGLPQNEANRARDFRATDGIEHYLQAFPRALEGVRAVGALSGASRSVADGEAGALPTAALAASVEAHYLQNVAQARAILSHYGVAAVHAWQPTVFGRASPTPFERRIIAASHRRHRDLQRAVDALLARDAPAGVLLLTDIFDADAQPVFLDALHLGPAGNRAVAAALLPGVLRALFPVSASSTGSRP